MPLSRDPRMDRRRRVLRDTPEEEQLIATKRSRKSGDEEPTTTGARRSAGYSQDVRGACGHRLVQLIPIRLSSFLATIAISFLVPCVLLVAHYKIYVSGSWPWYGHPMARVFDALHPQGISSWFCSQLWLLCLAATLLTFQLRKHKLDDYNGEYRLWFWLVFTCIIASIDSATHIIDLFGLALDKWSQVNLGWSGPAVVQATLAVLIGMLGLRLCGELKAVPASLVFWLCGLVAWAASVSLGQELLKVDLTIQFRVWLRCALWLGGLTAIWVAALSYLRSTYIEAQRRFLLRGRLAASVGVPIGRRIRESIPRMPAMPSFRRKPLESDPATEQAPRRWGMPTFGRVRTEDETQQPSPRPMAAEAQRQKTTSQPTQLPSTTRRIDHGGEDKSIAEVASASPRRGLSNFFGRKRNDEAVTQPSSPATVSDSDTPSRLSGWFRKAKDNDDAAEFRKVKAEEREQAREKARTEREARKNAQLNRSAARGQAQASEQGTDKQPRRGWIPKLGKPKLPSVKIPKIKRPSLAWLKIPSFSLASLRLNPPSQDDDEQPTADKPAELRPVQNSRPLPGTSAPDYDDDDEAEESAGRPMSKAERKRLRRLQQQNRAA
jgi:hypothetical protein